MSSTFGAPVVYCRRLNAQFQRICGGMTRFPLPNPLEPRIGLLSWPKASEPILVLCIDCWTVSRYTSQSDLSVEQFPSSDLSGGMPFYMAEIECDKKGCGLRAKVYVRVPAILRLPENSLLQKAIEGLKGIDAVCREGHPWSRSKCCLEKFYELSS